MALILINAMQPKWLGIWSIRPRHEVTREDYADRLSLVLDLVGQMDTAELDEVLTAVCDRSDIDLVEDAGDIVPLDGTDPEGEVLFDALTRQQLEDLR